MDGFELQYYVGGVNKSANVEIEKQDYLNYILSQYIAYIVNAPQSYPKKPLLIKEEKPVDLTPEQQKEQWMKWLRYIGAKEVQNGNNN